MKKSFSCKMVEYLIRLLPDRAKRAIFVISLLQLFKGNQYLTDKTLTNLNEVMKLGFSKESMRFPTYIHHLIWSGADEERLKNAIELKDYRELDNEEIRLLLSEVNEVVPTWQRYGTTSDMTRDVMRLLKNRKSILQEET